MKGKITLNIVNENDYYKKTFFELAAANKDEKTCNITNENIAMIVKNSICVSEKDLMTITEKVLEEKYERININGFELDYDYIQSILPKVVNSDKILNINAISKNSFAKLIVFDGTHLNNTNEEWDRYKCVSNKIITIPDQNLDIEEIDDEYGINLRIIDEDNNEIFSSILDMRTQLGALFAEENLYEGLYPLLEDLSDITPIKTTNASSASVLKNEVFVQTYAEKDTELTIALLKNNSITINDGSNTISIPENYIEILANALVIIESKKNKRGE